MAFCEVDLTWDWPDRIGSADEGVVCRFAARSMYLRITHCRCRMMRHSNATAKHPELRARALLQNRPRGLKCGLFNPPSIAAQECH